MSAHETEDSEERAALAWLQQAPKPRPRRPELDWDVFISYRSVNSRWALSLYDTLQETGYSIFLDQYELGGRSGLPPGLGSLEGCSVAGGFLTNPPPRSWGPGTQTGPERRYAAESLDGSNVFLALWTAS